MEIAVVGAGYVGLTTAACFCELGHKVRLVETNRAKVDALRQGNCPIYEPGLEELLARHLRAGLTVTEELGEAVAPAAVVFVCIGTPPTASGAPDLSALRQLVLQFQQLQLTDPKVVVLKSTVPPGTNRWVAGALGPPFAVVSNPEFLREGTALHDFFHPDRVIIGGADDLALQLVASFFEGIAAPVLTTGWEEAELIKYASNAFLAVKVAYANEIAALCDGVGAHAPLVLHGVGLDSRIGGHFLQPGPGYGGSCLPKDVQALLWRAGEANVALDVIPAAEAANQRQRQRLLSKLEQGLGALADKQIAVWGLAFKAGTDDVRGAASLDLVPRLLATGARVQAHDPAARETFAQALGAAPGFTLSADPWQALKGADALLVLTEWAEYRQASLGAVRSAMAGDLLVDGRNLYARSKAVDAGLRYCGVGQ